MKVFVVIEDFFARTLLEQIGVEFEYPILKEND